MRAAVARIALAAYPQATEQERKRASGPQIKRARPAQGNSFDSSRKVLASGVTRCWLKASPGKCPDKACSNSEFANSALNSAARQARSSGAATRHSPSNSGRRSTTVMMSSRSMATQKIWLATGIVAAVFERLQLGANEHRRGDEFDDGATRQRDQGCGLQRQRIPAVGKTQNVFHCGHQIKRDVSVNPTANGCVSPHVVAEALGTNPFFYGVVVVKRQGLGDDVHIFGDTKYAQAAPA